jgi:hypothetical protein
MIDIATAFILFGFPVSLVLLAWGAVKVHERRQPPGVLATPVSWGDTADRIRPSLSAWSLTAQALDRRRKSSSGARGWS